MIWARDPRRGCRRHLCLAAQSPLACRTLVAIRNTRQMIVGAKKRRVWNQGLSKTGTARRPAPGARPVQWIAPQPARRARGMSPAAGSTRSPRWQQAPQLANGDIVDSCWLWNEEAKRSAAGHTAGVSSRRPDSQDRRAIDGPLDSVARGLPRSGADTHTARSDPLAARSGQIPKLIVRVRFSSPAPLHNPSSGP
jgi:hypothetical protein